MSHGRKPPPGPGRDGPWGRRAGGPGAARDARPPAGDGDAKELRLHGLNAVRAVFARRPDAIRKLYLSEARIPDLQPMLKWCVARRVGYRVVADEDELRRLASSTHHEGVVADVLREPQQQLQAWLQALPQGACCALWLDGVGNPHNLGAILRSSAHFGVAGLLLPASSTLALSGAAARVAEGGAEAVPMVRLADDDAIARLRGAGFALAATVVRGGDDLFAATLPRRLVYVIGAEGGGMGDALAASCDLRLSIPGTGAVDSLNVAAATAVLLAQWRQRHPRAGAT
jgi:RNA methyltransferase, TrmH family